jgi:hypothetical protein
MDVPIGMALEGMTAATSPTRSKTDRRPVGYRPGAGGYQRSIEASCQGA